MGTMLTTKWNQGEILPDLLRKECLHHIFEEIADRFGNHVAVICDDITVTYNVLETQSNQMARYLRSKGIGCHHRVAILLERSIYCYVSMLGIMKAGAAYVPLDANYPEDRVNYIIQDCSISLVVTIDTLCGKKSTLKQVVKMDKESDLIAKEKTDCLNAQEIGVQVDDLCYCIYTSGTTGRPKGVLIEHRTASYIVRASQTIYGINLSDRIYQGFTIAFDASVEEI